MQTVPGKASKSCPVLGTHLWCPWGESMIYPGAPHPHIVGMIYSRVYISFPRPFLFCQVIFSAATRRVILHDQSTNPAHILFFSRFFCFIVSRHKSTACSYYGWRIKRSEPTNCSSTRCRTTRVSSTLICCWLHYLLSFQLVCRKSNPKPSGVLYCRTTVVAGYGIP